MKRPARRRPPRPAARGGRGRDHLGHDAVLARLLQPVGRVPRPAAAGRRRRGRSAACCSAPRRCRGGVALLLHILVVALLVWLMMGGSLLHPVGGAHHVANALNDAWTSSETYQPPIPATVPEHRADDDPLRRAQPAGRGHPGLLAAARLAGRAAAAGRLLRADQPARQRRLVGGVPARGGRLPADDVPPGVGPHHRAGAARSAAPRPTVDPSGFGVSTGASKTSASAVGGAAVVLAVDPARCSSRPCTSTASACSGRAAAAATASRWSTRSRT